MFDDVFVPKERVFLQRRDRFRGAARADLRALPSLHRGVVQAAAARTDGGRGLRDRRGQRRLARRPRARQADPSGRLSHDRARTDRACGRLLHDRGRPRGAQHAAHQRRQVPLRAQLSSGGADRAGPRGRTAGHGAGGRGPDQRGDARLRAEVHGRREGLRRREAAAAAQSDRRSDGVGLTAATRKCWRCTPRAASRRKSCKPTASTISKRVAAYARKLAGV